jgi:hypothetical protein
MSLRCTACVDLYILQNRPGATARMLFVTVAGARCALCAVLRFVWQQHIGHKMCASRFMMRHIINQGLISSRRALLNILVSIRNARSQTQLIVLATWRSAHVSKAPKRTELNDYVAFTPWCGVASLPRTSPILQSRSEFKGTSAYIWGIR